MRLLTVALSVALIAAGLAGCSAVEDINPFGHREKLLTGERTTVFSTNSPMIEASERKIAEIGPERANADWAQPGGNAANAPGHVAYGGAGARAWRASVASSKLGISVTRGQLRMAARPVVSNGRVFTYAPDGTVTALSLSGGGRAWRTSLRPDNEGDPALGGGITVDGGRVYVATGYSQLAALSASDGQVIWNRDLETPARSAPTAGGGKVFLVSQKNEVFAVNAEDGSQAFTYAGIPESSGLLAAASPAISGGKVVVPYSSGEVMAFSMDSGEPSWQSFVTRSMRTYGVADLQDISGSPVIVDGTVYATGVAGRTIAVTLNDGSEVWAADIGSPHTPVVSGSAVFLIDLANRMVALSRSTGETLWMTELPKRGKKRDGAYAGPVLAGGTLYAVSNNGLLAALNPRDGTLLSQKSVGAPAYTPPIVASGQMIYVSDAGEITALR